MFTSAGPNVRVEEYSAGEESISNTSSRDVSETEEHVTVHAKREPLPWSLRGPSYDKPLPGVMSSPVSERSLSDVPISPQPRAQGRETPVNWFDDAEGTAQTVPRASPIAPVNRSPFDAAPVVPAPSPIRSAGSASFEENSPPQHGRPLSGFDEEANIETAAFVTVTIPPTETPLVVPIQPVLDKQKFDTPSTLNLSGAQAPDITFGKQSPKPSQDLDALEAGHLSLGSKRGHSPALVEEHAPKQVKLSHADLRALSRLHDQYIKDWRVKRKYPAEKFYWWRLFRPARLSYVHVPRKQHPIPRKYRQVQEDKEDLGARYRRDWQVQRQYPVYKFFNPQLFDPGHLERVKTPMKRAEKQRYFWERMHWMGIDDVNSLAGRYRVRTWRSHRAHPVDTFFEPSLFESNVSPGDKLRADWYSLRDYPVEEFADGLSYLFETTDKSPIVAPLPVHDKLPEKEKITTKTVDISSLATTSAAKSSPNIFADSNDPIAMVRAQIPSLKSRGSTDMYGRQYDWPFWEKLLGKDSLEAEGLEDLLFHMRDPKYAIPNELRPAIWSLAAGSRSSPNLQSGFALLQGMPSVFDTSISEDVDRIARSYPLSDEQEKKLRNVLNAYANHDPETGYCPAMAALAAPLVVDASDEAAFVLFARIMQHYDHRRYLQPALDGTDILIFQLENLLAEIDPVLAVHLRHHDVEPAIFALEWYTTVFAPVGRRFQPTAMDYFLIDGHAALHRIALTLIIENRDELLECDSFAEMMEILHGDLLDAHPDWSIAEWMAVIQGLQLSSELLQQLEEAFYAQQQLHREQTALQEMSILEGEHDYALWNLTWLVDYLRYICLSRENYATKLHDLQHNNRVLLATNYRSAHRIHELQQELAEQEHLHHLQIKKLAENVQTVPELQGSAGEKVFRV